MQDVERLFQTISNGEVVGYVTASPLSKLTVKELLTQMLKPPTNPENMEGWLLAFSSSGVQVCAPKEEIRGSPGKHLPLVGGH
ncbi:hypothetical protein PN498_13460 [Oscillatoria sp. CS-180]|uniref:hypothetical protein n=1 Tax=Oscillatoria sp. CS-180 TaxID=3021720 RepID=UPI00232EC586|nr:hypothetical protein [Oscillatoria sp. CS-180]MDB9527002.1 hypothetical protein [Oscillatoria sp. CS-180]